MFSWICTSACAFCLLLLIMTIVLMFHSLKKAVEHCVLFLSVKGGVCKFKKFRPILSFIVIWDDVISMDLTRTGCRRGPKKTSNVTWVPTAKVLPGFCGEMQVLYMTAKLLEHLLFQQCQHTSCSFPWYLFKTMYIQMNWKIQNLK